MYIILGVSYLGFCFSVLMLVRNQIVYGARMKILNLTSAAATRDINEGKEWEWRFEMLKSVTYGQMMRKFWKSPFTFYPSDAFYK